MADRITKRKPTQADVARRAAVSQAMVSYVLNDRSTLSVPVETRRRILDAVDELGYVPNSAARSLRTRKTLTIAAIIPDITNPYYPAFIRGIQDVAETRGYDVISYNTDGDHAKELKALRSAQHGRVDGVILVTFHLLPTDLQPLADAGLALVMMGPNDPPWTEVGVDNLMPDNVEAARTAVNYLIDRGHTRIGMIAGVAGTPPRERGRTRDGPRTGCGRRPDGKRGCGKSNTRMHRKCRAAPVRAAGNQVRHDRCRTRGRGSSSVKKSSETPSVDRFH